MKKILKEDAINRLKNHNPNISLVGEYINLTKKTKFKCEICGNIKFSSFQDMLNSSRKFGCVKCEKRSKNKKEKSRTKSHEQYISEVSHIWKDTIKILGQYDGGAKKVDAKCNLCGHIWKPEAKALLAKHGCPKCGHRKNKESTVKKHSDYIMEVASIHKNIDVLGTYISNNCKILVKCNICQYEWSPVARNIIKGRGCPKCRLNKGETLIKEILDELNINYKPQYIIKNLKTTNNGTPIFDFAIFDNDKLYAIIEYDGKQHFFPMENWGGTKRLLEQQKIDRFKDEYCLKNNIKMIRIKYTEFNYINSNYIKHLLYE